MRPNISALTCLLLLLLATCCCGSAQTNARKPQKPIDRHVFSVKQLNDQIDDISYNYHGLFSNMETLPNSMKQSVLYGIMGELGITTNFFDRTPDPAPSQKPLEEPTNTKPRPRTEKTTTTTESKSCGEIETLKQQLTEMSKALSEYKKDETLSNEVINKLIDTIIEKDRELARKDRTIENLVKILHEKDDFYQKLITSHQEAKRETPEKISKSEGSEASKTSKAVKTESHGKNKVKFSLETDDEIGKDFAIRITINPSHESDNNTKNETVIESNDGGIDNVVIDDENASADVLDPVDENKESEETLGDSSDLEEERENEGKMKNEEEEKEDEREGYEEIEEEKEENDNDIQDSTENNTLGEENAIEPDSNNFDFPSFPSENESAYQDDSEDVNKENLDSTEKSEIKESGTFSDQPPSNPDIEEEVENDVFGVMNNTEDNTIDIKTDPGCVQPEEETITDEESEVEDDVSIPPQTPTENKDDTPLETPVSEPTTTEQEQEQERENASVNFLKEHRELVLSFFFVIVGTSLVVVAGIFIRTFFAYMCASWRLHKFRTKKVTVKRVKQQ